jgi:carbon-monoxide dehydrogenase small subunit
MSGPIEVTLSVNGRDYSLSLEPRRTLLDAIRDGCGLTGTHMGCEHGVCGACTVLLDGDPIRACLMFAVQAQGAAIRTVEGLATRGEQNPMQRAFIAHHGVQCGFCTPGFFMIGTEFWSEPDISEDDLWRYCRPIYAATYAKASLRGARGLANCARPHASGHRWQAASAARCPGWRTGLW